ncbi:MAG: hypothetical protein SWJ54_04105 [Cyanobacteriota bacterium]|nr:hypothetical protein [Cyanobacteriota bacterium]
MKRGFLLLLFTIPLLFFLVSPLALAHSLSIVTATSEIQTSQPVKTYVRSILPEIPEQIIKLNPPATQLVVNIKTGDVIVPCGNQEKVYTCFSGKPIEITSEPDMPIRQVWIQNPRNQMIQLTISVYKQLAISLFSEIKAIA